MATKNTVTIKGTTFRGCACGCGQTVGSATYRPGHDARHAGIVARKIAESGGDFGLLKELPSMALQDKASRHAYRLIEKAVAKEQRESAARAKATANRARKTKKVQDQGPDVHGTVKIGRWEYPAIEKASGVILRNLKRDGSGLWEPIKNANFEPTI